MEGKDLTPCCGVYCPDCIWYRNNFSSWAKELKDKLKRVDFERYASIKSPFGAELEYYTRIPHIKYKNRLTKSS